MTRLLFIGLYLADREDVYRTAKRIKRSWAIDDVTADDVNTMRSSQWITDLYSDMRSQEINMYR